MQCQPYTKATDLMSVEEIDSSKAIRRTGGTYNSHVGLLEKNHNRRLSLPDDMHKKQLESTGTSHPRG